MTIFILGTPEETAKALDDKALDKMIKALAQTLCNAQCELTVFYGGYAMDWKNKPPLGGKDINSEWSQWARECRANYLALVKYAKVCCEEWRHRFHCTCHVFADDDGMFKCGHKNFHKHHDAIQWCAENVPDLPLFQPGLSDELTVSWTPKELSMLPMPFPLVMPEKYKENIFDNGAQSNIVWATTQSYRNYYSAKLKEPIWTRREKPEWLGDL